MIMKIVYYTKTSFLDTDLPLIKSLQEQGHDVYVFIRITARSLNTSIFRIDKLYEHTGIFHCSVYPQFERFGVYCNLSHFYVVNDASHKKISTESIGLVLNVIKKIKELNPDVVHFIELPYILDIPIISRFSDKSILTIHDPVPHIGSRESLVYRLLQKLAVKSARKIILLNNTQTEEFLEAWNLNRKVVDFSLMGNCDWIRVYETTKKVQANKVLFYGRISKYKGVDVLLKAFEIVHKELPEAHLTIAGSGKFPFDITPYMEKDYISIENHFIDMPELVDLISETNIVVCPYIEATQSGVVSTVLAMGVPLIVTRVGTLPDRIINGHNGIVIEPSDIIALASAIVELQKDPKRVKSMRESIINDASAGDYSWIKIAMNTERIYKSIL